MPSYTETFACPVCWGTTTTTVGPSTTTPPGVCPEGYEPCEGQSTFIVDSDCIYTPWPDSDGQCPEGCTPFSPNWPTDLVDDCETYSPGTFVNSLCCRPITTTENPCPQGGSLGWLDAYNADLVCNYCQEFACITDDFNPHRTLQACIDVLMTSYQETGIPMCDVVATTPIP